jgi:hypothetical protein
MSVGERKTRLQEMSISSTNVELAWIVRSEDYRKRGTLSVLAGFTLLHRSDFTEDPSVNKACQDCGFKACSGLSASLSFFYVDKSLRKPVELFQQFSLESGPVFEMRKPEAPRLFDKLFERRIEGERGYRHKGSVAC